MIDEPTSKTNLPELARELLHLPFHQVVPSGTNPRLSLEREPFEELKKSICANGLLQPVVVRPKGDVYEIIGGHRRFRALQELAQEHPEDRRFTRVAVVVVEADDSMVPVLQLAENLNRSDLTAAEVAEGVARAVDSGVDAARLAHSLGWSKRNLNRYLQLAAAPPWLRALATEVVVPRKKLDADGQVVVNAKTRKPMVVVDRLPGLHFTDLTELLALYNVLREADAIHLEEVGGEGFRPQAEKATKRLAITCAANGWSKSKLREEIRRAKDPKPRTDEPKGEQEGPPIVVTSAKLVVDLRQAAALPIAARAELAVQLTRALTAIGFKNIVIGP